MPDPSIDLLPTLGPEQLEQLRTALRTVALRRLGDVDAAEDAAQETLLRVFTTVGESRLQDPARFYGFVWTVAQNVVADVGRRRQRAARLDARNLRSAPDAPEDPLAGLVSAEETARVRAALDRLPEPDRELLRLCYYEGLSSAELASRLGEPGPRLRKRKSRALERLRGVFLAAPPRPRPPQRPTEAERHGIAAAEAGGGGD